MDGLRASRAFALCLTAAAAPLVSQPHPGRPAEKAGSGAMLPFLARTIHVGESLEKI